MQSRERRETQKHRKEKTTEKASNRKGEKTPKSTKNSPNPETRNQKSPRHHNTAPGKEQPKSPKIAGASTTNHQGNALARLRRRKEKAGGMPTTSREMTPRQLGQARVDSRVERFSFQPRAQLILPSQPCVDSRAGNCRLSKFCEDLLPSYSGFGIHRGIDARQRS